MTRRQLVLATVVFAGFAAFGAWRSPVPGVNEPHYLCKAKHFSDPSWCELDFFLNSADAHWVFYALIGPVTRIFSLEQTAWIGRFVVWWALALGWVRLSGGMLSGRFSTVWSSAFFLAAQSTITLSGEWLVGGVEAKSFAYAALFLAIAAACRHSMKEAAVAMGVAISLHPVVGGWGVVALVAALFSQWMSVRLRGRNSRPHAAMPFSKRRLILTAAACLGCALPGLIPAVVILLQRPSVDRGRIADQIQVFERLDHHLDPAQFPVTAYVVYAGLLGAWLLLRRAIDQNAAERLFARFVAVTLAIAVAGLAIGFGIRSASLMKFYPFRLFDVFLPIATSIVAAAALERLVSRMPEGYGKLATAMGHALAGAALLWGLAAPGRIPNPSGYTRFPETWPAFIEACAWIDGNTPPKALVLTPKSNVGFKWYARRAEYVTWKDCPQDAAGILQWKARLNRIARWRAESLTNGISEIALAGLYRETGVDYMLTWTGEESSCKPVYRNRSFSVYRVLP